MSHKSRHPLLVSGFAIYPDMSRGIFEAHFPFLISIMSYIKSVSFMKEEIISRSKFIKGILSLGLTTAFIPYGLAAIEGTASAHQNGFPDTVELIKRMVVANDARVGSLLERMGLGRSKYGRIRSYGSIFGILTASYCHPGSVYYLHPDVADALEGMMQKIREMQNQDGTINSGNIASPPDTAFVIESIGAATFLLHQNNSQAIQNVLKEADSFLLKVGEALVTGGLHTPNHRWVVCAALARINRLYPDPRYTDRIREWLGEGIYKDIDGHFSERSRNYSEVINRSLITTARLMNMPELLEPAKKNLEMNYYYMDADGSLVTTDSRRQDQHQVSSIINYYLDYRYMSISTGSGFYAAVARFIEHMDGFSERILNRSLLEFMEEPMLQKELPEATILPTDYVKWIKSSHLLRIRRESTSMTLFGGVDWPLIIASGRSNSPNLFAYRKGDAVLKFLRISSRFFNTGYFYSEGLDRKGNAYVLHRRMEVPYYQPLPEEKRNDSGDYRLSQSIDGRFWNKMSFEDRAVSNVKILETTVSLEEENGHAALSIKVDGQPDVQVVVELCFKEGGSLSGVERSARKEDNSFLAGGMGRYQFGDDRITFGPGTMEHKNLGGLEGERYSTHRGTLRTSGQYVYLTGITPFEHTLKFS